MLASSRSLLTIDSIRTSVMIRCSSSSAVDMMSGWNGAEGSACEVASSGRERRRRARRPSELTFMNVANPLLNDLGGPLSQPPVVHVSTGTDAAYLPWCATALLSAARATTDARIH